jgi:ATP-dependent Clp protease ATP-binding subunit ClpA
MGRVVDKFIAELAAQLAEKKVRIQLSDAARSWLAERGFDPLFGARPLARVIQTQVKDKVSEEVLFGALAKGGEIEVDAADGALTFRFSGRTSQLIEL